MSDSPGNQYYTIKGKKPDSIKCSREVAGTDKDVVADKALGGEFMPAGNFNIDVNDNDFYYNSYE